MPYKDTREIVNLHILEYLQANGIQIPRPNTTILINGGESHSPFSSRNFEPQSRRNGMRPHGDLAVFVPTPSRVRQVEAVVPTPVSVTRSDASQDTLTANAGELSATIEQSENELI